MTPKFQTDSKLVLKMMFNYNAISTDSIFHEFEEEILFDKRDISKRKWLHPFIIPTERAFIAPFIDHPQENLYDAASPSIGSKPARIEFLKNHHLNHSRFLSSFSS